MNLKRKVQKTKERVNSHSNKGQEKMDESEIREQKKALKHMFHGLSKKDSGYSTFRKVSWKTITEVIESEGPDKENFFGLFDDYCFEEFNEEQRIDLFFEFTFSDLLPESYEYKELPELISKIEEKYE